MEKIKKQTKDAERVWITLRKQRKTQNWLISELAGKGIITNCSELSGVLHGVRRGPKVDRILEASKEILGL